MPGAYDDLYNLTKEYYQKFYGGQSAGSFSDQYYASQQAMLERKRKRMLSRLKDETSALREGYMPSGLDMQLQTERVDIPIAEAESALDFQKLQAEEAERQRRENMARQMALAKLAEQQEASRKRGGFWGKLLGTGAGMLIGSIVPGVGTAIGGALGGGLGSMLGGGNGGNLDTQSLYNLYYEQALKGLGSSPGNENPYDPEQSGIDATWDPETQQWIKW